MTPFINFHISNNMDRVQAALKDTKVVAWDDSHQIWLTQNPLTMLEKIPIVCAFGPWLQLTTIDAISQRDHANYKENKVHFPQGLNSTDVG